MCTPVFMLSLVHRAHMTHFGNALYLYGVWSFWFSEDLDDTTGRISAECIWPEIISIVLSSSCCCLLQVMADTCMRIYESLQAQGLHQHQSMPVASWPHFRHSSNSGRTRRQRIASMSAGSVVPDRYHFSCG